MKCFFCICAWLLSACAVLTAPAPEEGLKDWGASVNPDKNCKIRRNGSAISIEMPGTDHDYNPYRKQFNAPRFLQKIEGEFDLRVRVQIESRHSAQSTVKGEPSCVAAWLMVLIPETERPIGYRFEFGITQRGAEVDDFVTDNQLPPDHKVPGNEAKGESRKKVSGEDGYAAGKVWFANGGQKPDMTWDRSFVGEFRMARSREWKDWPLPKKPECVYLRMEKRGQAFHSSISTDGSKWVHVHGPVLGTATAKAQVGFGVSTSSTEPSKVRFDQIKLILGEKKAK